MNLLLVPFMKIESVKKSKKEFLNNQSYYDNFVIWEGTADIVTWNKYFKVIE